MSSSTNSLKSKVFPKKSSVFSLQSLVSRRRSTTAGFTLLELLIVIALIMVLAGLMIPAFFKIQNKAKEKKRSIEVSIIESAIQAYKLQEKKFPVDDPKGVANDVVYGGNKPNSEVMDKLKETNPPVLDVNKLRWKDGNVVDPDGNQYKITIDLNYDGQVSGSPREYKVE